MPKQPKTGYLFTSLTEMRGIVAPSSWMKTSMREAINMGTGGWFCLYVNGKFRAAVEMENFLVKLGFQYCYEYAKQEENSAELARAAYRWRTGKIEREEVDKLIAELQKERDWATSRPLMVAYRLAQTNPCAVLSAACIDQAGADFTQVAEDIRDYARRVIRV